jgi:hypothetical protein
MPSNLPLRTSIYIDGFNLYYGLLKGSMYKWVDLDCLIKKYLDPSKNPIQQIKYFTALVKSRPNDPQQHIRQETYLRALQTIPNFEIIYGHFLSHVIRMPRADGNGMVEVIKTEEKKSDVNIAVHLLHDAHIDKYDLAVLISNDSDLSEPLRIITEELGKKVGILNPQARFSYELGKYAMFKKRLRLNVAASCQFPNPMSDQRGHFHKPPVW